MAEAFGIASGIAGLVSLTIEVLKITCQFASTITHAERSILDCLHVISSLDSVLSKLEVAANTSELVGNALSRQPGGLSTTVLNGCKERLIVLETGLKKQLNSEGNLGKRNALKWPFKKDETTELIRQLEGYRDTFHTALSVDIFTVTTATYTEVRGTADDKHRKDILNWLGNFNVSSIYFTKLEEQQKDTCRWIFATKEYRNWLANDGARLWCHGAPGCGKSVLTATIIEHLTQSSGRGLRLLYHFCDYKDPEKQTLQSIIRSFISQVVLNNDVLPVELESLYTSKQSGYTIRQPSVAELTSLLTKLCLRDNIVTIVIDALDETREWLSVIKFLRTLEQSRVRILLISRKLPDIEAAVSNYATYELRAQNYDISTFVSHRLVEVEENVSLSQKIKDQIIETVVERSSGI